MSKESQPTDPINPVDPVRRLWLLILAGFLALGIALLGSWSIVVLRSSSDVVSCTAEELEIEALDAAAAPGGGQGTLAAGPLAQDLTSCPAVDYGPGETE